MKKADKNSSNKVKAKETKNVSSMGLVAGLVVLILLGLGGLGFAFRDTIRAKFSAGGGGIPNQITKEEMELLVKDFPPMQLKAMSENPEQKQQLIDNIKELLAIANQAVKDGVADQPAIKQDLQSVEESTLAFTYDQKVNGDKGQLPPFAAITEEQVKQYWEAGDTAAKEKKFKEFIDAKIDMARKAGQIPEGQEPSEEELNQAKEAFAKTQIYYEEAKDKLANLGSLTADERKEWEELQKKANLQTKLQKAQLLAQAYFKEVGEKKLEVTDEEVATYIKENPELGNSEEKKKIADEVLEKVKSGGDFAALAKEYSEDPGSKDKGGLYEGIAKGQFAPEFEEAVLALEPGEYTKDLVKTKFGYHVIQLVKKGEQKDPQGNSQETFDARHILISTMVKDPENPMAQEMSVDDYAKAQLEKKKQEDFLAEIKANNPVQVAENFEIPEVSEEEIKKMQEERMKQQQQMQQQMQQMQQGEQPAPEGNEKEETAPKEKEKE